MKRYEKNGYVVTIEGTWFEISNHVEVVRCGSCLKDADPKELFKAWNNEKKEEALEDKPDEPLAVTKKSKKVGSVTRRNDGRYVGTVNIGRDTVTGKYKRKYVYGRTVSEVRKKLYEIKVKLEV